MKIIGFAGWSGAGKTTLITRLLPLLTEQGFVVSTVKHAHHGFDLDRPGKDSYLHRMAGAHEVLVASDQRWALLHEERAEPRLSDLLARLTPCDLVLIEGFRRDPHPKIEVHRAANGKPFMFREDPAIVTVAGDTPPVACPLPFLDLADLASITDAVLASAAPFARQSQPT